MMNILLLALHTLHSAFIHLANVLAFNIYQSLGQALSQQILVLEVSYFNLWDVWDF